MINIAKNCIVGNRSVLSIIWGAQKVASKCGFGLLLPVISVGIIGIVSLVIMAIIP
jgi:hypothetical protein